MSLLDLIYKPAIRDLQNNRDVAGLIRALRRDDTSQVADACEALGKLQDKRALPALLKVLRDAQDQWCRTKAAWALGDLQDQGAVEGLISALRDPVKRVRAAAARSLSQIPDLRSAPYLIEALGQSYDDEDMLGSNAAMALGKIGSSAACDALEDAVLYAGHQVAVNAAVALSGINDTRVLEPLQRFLETQDNALGYDTANIIATGVRRLGRPSIPLLVECLKFAGGFYRVKEAHAGLVQLAGISDHSATPDYDFWTQWLATNTATLEPPPARKALPGIDEHYVNGCLQHSYQELPETRSWDSDPAFKTVTAALYSKDNAAACRQAEALIIQFSDFSQLYLWWGEAFRGLGSLDKARQVLMQGLEKGRQKYGLCSFLGQIEIEAQNINQAVYWWAQALHCLESLQEENHDAHAYVYLHFVASGMDLPAYASAFFMRAKQIVDVFTGDSLPKWYTTVELADLVSLATAAKTARAHTSVREVLRELVGLYVRGPVYVHQSIRVYFHELK